MSHVTNWQDSSPACDFQKLEASDVLAMVLIHNLTFCPQEFEPIHNFLSALEMLHEFRVSILPIVLKNGENQKNVVRKILQVDPQVCFSFS